MLSQGGLISCSSEDRLAAGRGGRGDRGGERQGWKSGEGEEVSGAPDTLGSLLSTGVHEAALAKTPNHLRLLRTTHLVTFGVYVIAFPTMSRQTVRVF